MIDIGRWNTERWDQVLGCEELVEHFRDIIRAAIDGDLAGVNTAVFGPSRSGKTSTIKLFIRSLMCQHRDPATLNPCGGTCYPCRQDANLFGLNGIEAQLAAETGARPIHFIPIDCTSITEQELRDRLTDLRDYEGLRIVYFDEAHRLHRRIMDEQLLKPVEERRGYMWILSAATTGDLEQMFQNRFVKIRTSLPTQEQLALWLAQRCKDWGITWDEPDTLIRLAERSRLLAGLALQVLARAKKRRANPKLTGELVERHTFDLSV